MTILTQYRQYRQRPTAQGLYPLAERLGLLAYPEPQTGTINAVRFGQVNLLLNCQLNYPDKTLTASLYREFSEIQVLEELRGFGLNESEILLLIEVSARNWLDNCSIEEALQEGLDAVDLDTYTLYCAQPGGIRALDTGEDLIESAFNRALQKMECDCFAQWVEEAA